MRTIEFSNGSKKEVRAMTGKEIVEGRDNGFGPMSWQGTNENFNDACLHCIGKQFDADFFDDLPASDQRKAFKAILAETYSDPGEEKNSPTSGHTDQTKES